MRRKRIYWVGLLAVIKALCKYINAYEGKLPPNLPAAVYALFPYARAACAALEQWDKDQPRGNSV